VGKVILPLIIFTSLTLGFNASAFTLNNNASAAFSKDEVSVNVAAHSCANLGITNDELLSIGEEAGALFWNKVPSSRLILNRGGLQSVATAFQTGTVCSNAPLNGAACTLNSALSVPSDILISCNTNGDNFDNNNGVLAVTLPNNVSGRDIIGSLILINDVSGNSFAGKSRQEQISIISHEIGHALGLGHSEFENNLMYFESRASRIALGWDDVDGITYLYPVEQPIDGCGAAFMDIDDHFKDGGKGPKSFLLTFVLGILLSLGLKVFGKSKTLQKSVPA